MRAARVTNPCARNQAQASALGGGSTGNGSPSHRSKAWIMRMVHNSLYFAVRNTLHFVEQNTLYFAPQSPP